MKPRSLTDEILRLSRLEILAERRFNRAFAGRNTHTARRAAKLWHAVFARFGEIARANVSTFSS
jgi:hypothetical protein